MSLLPTDEHEELRRTVRRFCQTAYPPDRVRKLIDDDAGYDPTAWATMAGELGLQSLPIPEEYGGAGFGLLEIICAAEEMGRSLLPGPFLSSSIIATLVLVHAADEQTKSALLPTLADGTSLATLALVEDGGSWDPTRVDCDAKQSDGQQWQLTGSKMFVLDAHVADTIIVLARTSKGPSLFRVEAGAPGLTVEPLPCLDLTRRMSRVSLDGVMAALVGTDGDAETGVTSALDRAAIALAAEALGGAEHCLDAAVAYANDREQFGQRIGSFQAVKHKCADMLVEVESARAAITHACEVAQSDPEHLSLAASLAKAVACDAFVVVAGDSLQVHGGIGFTWEHDAHLYLRRAKVDQALLGGGAHHRDRVGRELGI